MLFGIIGITLMILYILLFKNHITLSRRLTICDAIFRYKVQNILDGRDENPNFVDYTDMESYEKTLFRIYDWGYKNILPKDKFNIIKPFIEV